MEVKTETTPKVCGEFTVEELRPIADMLGKMIKGVKLGKPIWPRGERVYFVASSEGFVKIGFTTNLTTRFCDLQIANPLPLRLLASVPGPRELEREYHRRFAANRTYGEWFKACPALEAEITRLQGVSL